MDITKVEEFIGYNIAKDIVKQAVGDGMEFEFIYQAILDSMKNDSSIGEDENVEKNTYDNVSTSASSRRLDDIELIMMNSNDDVYGRNPIDYMVTRVQTTNNSTGSSNNSESSSNSSYKDIINNLDSIVNKYEAAEGEELAEIYSTVEKYCNQYGVDKNLVLAIIKQESNFDANVVSHAGAMGLMQLMDFNCEAYGLTDPFDIDQNIGAGVKHIKSYLDMYDGDVEMALMAYNGGPGTMSRRGVTSAADLYKMPEETQNYVPKVMNYYKNGFSL